MPLSSNSALAGTSLTWTSSSSSNAGSWYKIASSEDGKYQVANAYSKGVYYTQNYGETWTAASLPSGSSLYVTKSAAISSSGQVMYSGSYASTNSYMYKSENFGATWSRIFTTGSWWGTCTSSDGRKVAAADITSNKVYISSDTGTSYTSTSVSTPLSGNSIRGLVCSSDLSKMIVLGSAGSIARSTDSGATFTKVTMATGVSFYDISASKDMRVVAAANTSGSPGGIYLSTDYGLTWTKKTPNASKGTFYSVAVSGNGSIILAPDYSANQKIYLSQDTATSWTEQTTSPITASWMASGVSGDGSLLSVAGNGYGNIFTARTSALKSGLTPTFGTVSQSAAGFSVPISNYDATNYTWSVSTTAGSATISSGTVTVSGLTAGQSATITVTSKRSGYQDGTGTQAGSALAAALTPTFNTSSETATATGFTIQISNYDSNYTWSGTNSAGGTVSISGTGLVTVSGLGAYVGSTITINTTRSGYANGSATSSTYYSQKAALTPTFDTTTATRAAGGFTLKISNYDANYTWSGTTSAVGGSVSINSSGLITVSGLGDGVSSTVTITTTRSTYPNGSATSASYTTLGAALVPSYDTYTATADGFTAVVKNYDSNYTWSASSSKTAGTATISVSGGVATLAITGLGANETSTATVTTSRSGYRQGSSTTTVNTSKQNQTLTVTTPSAMTVGDADTSVVASASSGGSITLTSQSASVCTIVGGKIRAVDAGTCLVSVAQSGTSVYNSVSQSITFTINAGAAKVPTFDSPVATATGYTVNVTNYSTSETYTATVSAGSASIGSATGSTLPITVSGLSANQSSSLTVKTTRPGFATGQATVSGTSKMGATLTIINVIPTGDGATFQVSATGATAGTPSAYKTGDVTATRTVTGPTSGVYTVTGAANGENLTINVPWTATSSYSGSGTATTTVNVVSPPDSPTSVTLDVAGVVGDGKLRISWTAPASNGGSSITKYEYRLAPTGTSSWGVWTATSDTSTSAVISGLPSAKAYIAQVRAVNVAGYSSPSSSSASGTTTGVAASQRGAPTNFGVTAGNGQLSISFTPPIATGVDAITDYQYRLNGGSWNSLTYSGDTPVVTGTITGLTNGTTYTVGIRAVNAFGPGLEGSTSGRPATTPAVPTGLAVTASTGQLNVTFTSLTATQSGVNDSTTVTYQYQYRISGGTWNSWSDSATTTSRTISGISNSTTYEVRIRAINNAGLTSDSSTAVSTDATQAVAPTISTQPVSKNLTSGQSGFSLTVTATKNGVSGETLSYRWYKDGIALAVETSTATYETSTVTASSAGSYTVIVYARVNGTVASTTSSAAVVTVNGAPTVTSSTLTDTATVGSAFTQTLSATGGTGTYSWTGSGLPAGLTLSSSGVLSGTPTTANSSATFTVYVSDSNSITSATKTITLRIAPSVSVSTSSLSAGKKLTSYSQTLKASGGTGSYTWNIESGSLPAGLSLNSSTGAITGTPSSGSSSATLTFSATDANGSSSNKSFTIEITSGIPTAPTNLIFNSADDGAVNLTWTAPSDNGGSAIQSYVISVYSSKSEDHDDEDSNSYTVSATGLTFPYKVSGLSNGRSYKISISAKNASATGPASNEVTASPGKVADAPRSISAVRSSSGISIRWKKAENEYGFATTSFSMRCRVAGGSYFDVATDQSPGKGDDDYYSLSLTAGTYGSSTVSYGTSYSCQVRGKSAAGYSAWSSETTAITLAKAPKTPALSSYDTSTAIGKITVVMNKPSGSDFNGYDTITAYGVSLKSSSAKEDDDDESERSCTTTRPSGASGNSWDAQSTYSCTLTGTPTKGSYLLYLYAINSIGKSAYETVSVTMPGKAQTISVSSTTITKKVGDADFAIGASTNSGLKPTYTVKSGSTAFCSITERGFVHIIKDGECNITVSQNGRSGGDDDEDSEYGAAASIDVKVVITAIPPSIPSWGSIVAGNTKVTVNWNAPSGGGSVASYDIQYTSDGGSTWEPNPTPLQTDNATTTARKLDVTGLVNGKSYQFRIRATNGALSSSWVTTSLSYTPFGPPLKPVISSVVVTATSSSALVTWTAPGNNGDTITAYSVRATSGSYLSTCSVGGTTYSCTIGSLQNKNTYSFALVASNRAGSSDTSTAVTAYVDGLSQTITVPSDKIPALKGWYVGDPDVQLVASASSGLAIQYASSNSSICTVSSSGSVHFVAEGTCQVTIKQDGSGSKYNAAPDATPIQMVISPVLPSAPTITKVEWDATGLKVTWTAPTRTGGGTLSYTATASPGKSGTGTTTCSTSSLTCIIPGGGGSGIDTGVLETIYVTATISAGSGPASDTKTATWYTVPSAPTADSGHSSAKSSSNGRAIDVYWKKSDSSNGSPILRYTASAGGQSCSVVAASAQDSTYYTCSISGLTAGTSYAVTVLATNAAGNSTNLDIGNITPGISQTISLSPNTTSYVKNFGDPNFTVGATVSSGKSPTFTTSNSSVVTVSSSGVVTIAGVGTATITVASGADSSYLAATSVTISVTVNAVAPGKPVITSISPQDQKIVVKWRDPSFLGTNLGVKQFALITDSANVTSSIDCSGQATSGCTLSGLFNDDVYSLVIREANSASPNSLYADSDSSGDVSPIYSISAPIPVTLSGGVKQITVNWTTPTDIGTGLTLDHYVIEYGTNKSSPIVVTTTDSATLTTNFNSLADNTKYWVRVRAVATDGTLGQFSSWVSTKTLNVPDAPTSLTFKASYSSGPTLIVSWRASSSDGGSAIDVYTVTATAGGVTKSCTANYPSTTCTLTGLAAGTTYTGTVKAHNAVGDSFDSASASGTTIDVPGAPQNVLASADSSTAIITINWTAPESSGGSDISGYTATVTYSPSNTSLTCVTASTSCTISGGLYKETATVTVYATNIAGNGVSSSGASLAAINKSQQITFDNPGTQSLSTKFLTLTASGSSGLSITFSSSTTNICTVSGNTLSLLTSGTCTVTAAQSGNAIYDAATSVTQSFSVTPSTPAIMNLVQVLPGATSLTIRWTSADAAALNGSTFSKYSLSWATSADFTDESSRELTSQSDTTSVLTGLKKQTVYYVRIQLLTSDFNAISDSRWSNVLTGTPYGLPSAPDTVGVTVYTDVPGSMTVTWASVTNDGGTPVTGYTAEAYSDISGTVTATGLLCTNSGNSCVISGLSGSVYYFFKVFATNAVGNSPLTSTATSTRAGLTQTITASSASVSHDKQTYQVVASSSSGLPVKYSVKSQIKGANADSDTICTVDENTGLLSLFSIGDCVVQVTQNGNDASGTPTAYLEATPETATITVTFGLPSGVENLSVTPGDQKLIATWNIPSDVGGAVISGYRVTWFPSDARPTEAYLDAFNVNTTDKSQWTQGGRLNVGNVLTYTILNLENGKTYRVIVQAINAAGGMANE